jgi:hypothetical protein
MTKGVQQHNSCCTWSKIKFIELLKNCSSYKIFVHYTIYRSGEYLQLHLKHFPAVITRTLIWLRIWPVAGSWKQGSEPLGSIKCLEIFECLSNWRLLKKGSASWSLLFCN